MSPCVLRRRVRAFPRWSASTWRPREAWSRRHWNPSTVCCSNAVYFLLTFRSLQSASRASSNVYKYMYKARHLKTSRHIKESVTKEWSHWLHCLFTQQLKVINQCWLLTSKYLLVMNGISYQKSNRGNGYCRYNTLKEWTSTLITLFNYKLILVQYLNKCDIILLI